MRFTRRRRIPLIVAAALAAIAFAILWAPAAHAGKAREISWQITNASVVRTGQTSEISDGTLTNGYTVEATAAALGEDVFIHKGKFTLMIMAFSPNKDTPNKKAGRWYVQGTWSITGQHSGPTTRTRRTPTAIQGDLIAELSFNPASRPGNVEAVIKVPRALLASQWATGEGTFSGNEKFEGTLSVILRPRGEAKGGKNSLDR